MGVVVAEEPYLVVVLVVEPSFAVVPLVPLPVLSLKRRQVFLPLILPSSLAFLADSFGRLDFLM